MNAPHLRRTLVPRDLLTPRGLLLRAVLFVACFAVCHLAGWRPHASILSGTVPSPGGFGIQAMLGTLYLFAYVGITVAAPILALAAACLGLLIPQTDKLANFPAKDHLPCG